MGAQDKILFSAHHKQLLRSNTCQCCSQEVKWGHTVLNATGLGGTSTHFAVI